MYGTVKLVPFMWYWTVPVAGPLWSSISPGEASPVCSHPRELEKYGQRNGTEWQQEESGE